MVSCSLISHECVDAWPQILVKEQIKFHNKYWMAIIPEIIESLCQMKSRTLLPVFTTYRTVSQHFGVAHLARLTSTVQALVQSFRPQTHLLLGHLLQLFLPSCPVIIQVVGSRWGESTQNQGVTVMAEGCQMSNVQLQLAAILIKF